MPSSGSEMAFYILKFIFVMWSFFFNKGNILSFVSLWSFFAVFFKKEETIPEKRLCPAQAVEV